MTRAKNKKRYMDYLEDSVLPNKLLPVRKFDEEEIETYLMKQARLHMMGEERAMKKWQIKADSAWNMYMKGRKLLDDLPPSSDNKLATYEQASGLFTGALATSDSASGAHTRLCYFLRARCTLHTKYPQFKENALMDLQKCIAVDAFKR